MKRVEILSSALIPGDAGEMKVAHVGSILDLDDDVAGLLIAGSRAVLAPEGAKLRDTAKAIEAEADRKAAAQASPEAAMAALIAAAVQAALTAAPAKPAEPAPGA